MSIQPEKLMNLADGKVLYDDLRTRIPLEPMEFKINTTAYWNNQLSYVPRRGLMIVYTDHGQTWEGRDIPGIKIGDGNAYLVDLPFVGAEYAADCLRQLEVHVRNGGIHVTPEEKERWNNKLSYAISGTTLVLNKE